jgi:Domain of unknown function (DUF4189)
MSQAREDVHVRYLIVQAIVILGGIGFGLPIPAFALQTCGPGEIQSGGGNAGYIICTPIEAESTRPTVPASDTPYVRQSDYSAIAWHPDANDVWASARYPSREAAEKVALGHCEKFMGGGCGTAWQADGFIAVGRGPDGTVNWGIGRNKREAEQYLADQCNQFVLGCTSIGTFKSTDTYKTDGKWVNIREPKNIGNVRRLYGVAVSNRAGYDNKVYIATGHVVYDDAERAAKDACKQSYSADAKCEVAAWSGNGYILAYKSVEQDHVLVEQTPERVRQAMDRQCKKDNLECAEVRMIDVRTPGLITQKM